MKLEQIQKILKENKTILAERFKVEGIGVFGSLVRGKEKSGSDVDILVEFYETISLLDFVALEDVISELIGEKVDLVMKSALKPRIGKHILREVVYI
ncbi:nucleotidyltransferase family protein [bacterium]|nr:nucleotidyltransferase family protein [bacterium]MBU1598700.1 nucleotidyltransferase family protein [bacterium]